LVAVCIPARNEAANIEACIRAILDDDSASRVVVVYDDQSDDDTPAILSRLMASDARVMRAPTRPLPSGWVGKQWACQNLGEFALGLRHGGVAPGWILFIDADVRLSRGCLGASIRQANSLNAGLLSTFPRQVTRTLGEALIVPLIHFILLSYLPFVRMRHTRDPASSAACGQYLFVRPDAYAASGGHASFKDSMHDGVKMPRAIRRAGFHSDLFDATRFVSCRMYRGWRATWRGFAKNAYEGLGSPFLLVFLTGLHLWGHILPWLVALLALAWLPFGEWSTAILLACGAVVFSLLQRLLLAARFRQSFLSAAMHPIGVLLMTIIQWHSFALHCTGRRNWRGRVLPAAQGQTAPGNAGSDPGVPRIVP
jgi:glycosyltransferase involved in cell wall biosynthesis